MGSRRDRWTAVAVFACLFVVYNANGREIGSYDSQVTKLAARELLLRGTLTLNHVVGASPSLVERPGFALARDGRYRSAYSPIPAILAAAICWPLWRSGLVDVRAPRAPGLIAAVSASLLTSLAVAIAFLAARRRLSWFRALLLAIGFGLGTGLWSTVSQTLWQHETVVLGFAIATYAIAQPREHLGTAAAVALGIGLGLAGVARPQVAPAIAIVLLGTFARGGWRRALLATTIVAGFAGPLAYVNVRWFGTVLGAGPMLEALHETVHATGPGSFHWQPEGLLGLLLSPSRGLLIFSPVVAVAALGLRSAIVEGWRSPLGWCALAATAQYLLYASYVTWWGGHTYGPRYMLDVLPLLLPLAAGGLATVRGIPLSSVAYVALLWSVLVAGLGAFYYPSDRWNSEPLDVDQDHARLWNWRDTQITRCWHAGPSPQNFNLFTWDAMRVPSR